MAECVFCKIRDGQIPSLKIYEDSRVFCIMDINPINPGHCLVITRTHGATIWESEEEDLAAAVRVAKRVATGIREALAPDGLNVLQANGPAAFQSVGHFHLHLIPRWEDDGKGFDWPLVPGDKVRIAEVGEQLRAALGTARS
jgi:histidine triad (HIT) family protein